MRIKNGTSKQVIVNNRGIPITLLHIDFIFPPIFYQLLVLETGFRNVYYLKTTTAATIIVIIVIIASINAEACGQFFTSGGLFRAIQIGRL